MPLGLSHLADTYAFSDKDHWALIAKINEKGLWRVSYGELEGLNHDELRERLPMKYNAMFPGPKPAEYNLDQFSPYRIHQRCASSFRVGRVLLAGDAAHCEFRYPHAPNWTLTLR